MFREFLSKNGRSITVISVLLVGWLLVYFFGKEDRTAALVQMPSPGHIYIFEEDNVFAPMRLDSVSDTKLYMRNYIYFFTDAIPERDQILDAEFDENFFAIYDRTEIKRLHQEGNIVFIYPN